MSMKHQLTKHERDVQERHSPSQAWIGRVSSLCENVMFVYTLFKKINKDFIKTIIMSKGSEILDNTALMGRGRHKH